MMIPPRRRSALPKVLLSISARLSPLKQQKNDVVPSTSISFTGIEDDPVRRYVSILAVTKQIQSYS